MKESDAFKNYWDQKHNSYKQQKEAIYELLDMNTAGPSDIEINAYDVVDELIDLLVSKHNDYGPKNISDSPGGAINGLRVRMHDKLARINNLFDNNKHTEPEHEAFEDSFKDMANYAIIGILVLRGKWDA
jgi:hypothetical protein